MTKFAHTTARNAYGIEFIPRKAVHVMFAASMALVDRKRKGGTVVTARDLTDHANGPLSIAEGMDYWLRAGVAARVALMVGNQPRIGYQFNQSRIDQFYEVFNKTDGYGNAPHEQFLVYLITKAWELGRPIQRRDAYDLFSRGTTIRREVMFEGGILEAYTDPEHSGRYCYQATEYGSRVVSGWLELTELIDGWRETGFVMDLAVVPTPTRQRRSATQHFLEAVNAH